MKNIYELKPKSKRSKAFYFKENHFDSLIFIKIKSLRMLTARVNIFDVQQK